MSAPLNQLKAQISELLSDFELVRSATYLRPRLGEGINHQANQSVLSIITQFMNAKGSRPEGIYGPLLVRLIAIFERYLRALVADTADRRAGAAKTFGDLSKHIATRHVVLSGRALGAIEAPRDYLPFDINVIIANLASCSSGSGSFRLNAQAFSAEIAGVTPKAIEKALGNLDVSDWWDLVGNHSALPTLLGTKGPRDTGNRAREMLQELCRWRNHLAHGGDDIAISESQLNEAILFIDTFTEALDDAVSVRLKK